MASDETSVTPCADPARRDLFRLGGKMTASALIGLAPAPVRSAAWVAGSDAPEKREVRVGFIPLTDCSSVVMAAAMAFDRKYGIRIVLSRQTSWASVRDKLVSGALDAAHVLWGLVYAVQTGIGGPKKDMAILMNLNHNGQAITLSRRLHALGVVDGGSLKALIGQRRGACTFAQTFATGTHAMWLYYWLASFGIDPYTDVKTITVPPPQMVAGLRAARMDGYCVGEPWNDRAIADGIGFTVETSQGIWPDHPEKALGTTAEFVRTHPNTARALTAAVIDAGRWIDASPANRRRTAETVAAPLYVDTDRDVILARMLGRYHDGIGRTWNDPHPMTFFGDGFVPFPFLSDGMWFMTQHRRWGLLKSDPDYLAIATQVNRLDVYRAAAAAARAPVPADTLRSSRFIDGTVWDGLNPRAYAAAFPVRYA